MSTEELKIRKIVKQIADINKLVTAEYDFKYGDGSGKQAYDMEKLSELRNDAIDGFVSLIETQILEANINKLKELDSQAVSVDIDMKGQTYVNPGPTFVVFHHQITSAIKQLEAEL